VEPPPRIEEQRPDPAPQPVLVDAAMEEPAPRKWQPPAPTVSAERAERKSGWWSKK